MTMSEPEEKPLTAYALKRLRQLAKGNGIEPSEITIGRADEKDLGINGLMRLTPTVEVHQHRQSFRQFTISKDAKEFATMAELIAYVSHEQEKYSKSREWFSDIKTDIDAKPGKGWGLDQTHISHGKMGDMVAYVVERCPQCHGQTAVLCDYCVGHGVVPCQICGQRGHEVCYTCFGQGRNPSDQEQVCYTCNGTGYAVCRTCQGRGTTGCANCRGSGSVPCPPCEATGKMVESAGMKFGADLAFSVAGNADLPAALRRALDKYGIKFIINGHADIDYGRPEDGHTLGMVMLHYIATMACSDMVVNFGKEKKQIVIFGKKRAMLEVPPFLDKSLAEGIKLLKDAAKGQADLDQALKFRALNDACRLVLSGQGSGKNLRRQYPYGLSKNAADTIIRKIRLALRRATMLARYAAAGSAVAIAAGLGAALYLTPVHGSLSPSSLALTAELALPLIGAALAYIATEKAAMIILRRKFPDIVPNAHHGGHMAIIAALAAFLAPFGISLLRPETALWLRQVYALLGS
ncbi:MAG: hypothetical protein WDO70_11455 [Alphaproteobacteria bacterium]